MIPSYPIILILIPLLVIPASSSRPSPVPPNLLVFREPLNPTPLQQVVFHDKQVVVGGRNTLYHFDADLKLLGKVSTGPRLDNPNCLYPTFPCNYSRTSTDDDIKLLLVIAQDEDEDEPLLLNCGTLYQGACRVRPLANIAGPRSAWVGPLNETVGLVGSPLGSTVGFVSTAGALWTGATYDEERPVSKTAVASRELLQGEEGFRLEYSHETDTEFTGLHFDPKYRRVYKVDYIHAFEHENFAYFLQTQRVAIESENFETRLARVCSSDPTFFSYTELPLRCHYGLEVYALATAAYVGPAGDLLGRRLKLPGGGAAQVLYVSFVKPMPGHGSGVTDRTKGSVVCSFPMSTVVEAFTNATKQCFRAEARTQLLKHVVGSEMSCKSQDSVKIDDTFCGSGLNRYIGGRESLPGGFRTYLDAQVTSLVVTLQKGKAVAVAGTDTGDVYKIHLEKRKQLYALNIADGEEDKAVRRSNALDASHENVYFLVGDRAVKFPVGSCSVYRDCGSCLNTDDPLGCGWCGDHCASLEECETPAALMTVTCPPVIYELSPLSGPTEGGTVVSIAGDNFGSSHAGELHSTLTVSVAGLPCQIILWEKERLQCKTSAVSGGAEMSGPVVVNVTDQSWSHGEFDQKGIAIAHVNFTYVVPKLFGVHPGKGPVSGGTNVTIYGSSMDAGSSHTLTMAGVPCVVLSIQSSEGWCVTGNSTSPAEGPVLLLMDDAVIEVEASSSKQFDGLVLRDFAFLPDPQVINIHPHATTLSGTVNVSVSGEHLDSVAHPEMMVMVASTLTGEKLEFHEPCWVLGPEHMSCRTPPLVGHPGLHAPTERAPLVTHVAFLMDGAPGPRDLPLDRAQLLYYPDPDYETFEAGLVKKPFDEAHLEIKGRFLGLAQSPSDILVTLGSHVCNVTSVDAERLLCLIPAELVAHRNATAYPVEVSSGEGRLKQHLGFIEFVERETSPVTIAVLTASVLVACIIACLVYLYCRRVARRKRHPGYIVAYTAEQRQQNQSNGEACGGARRQDSNDYHDLRGRNINHQISATKDATAAKWHPDEAEVSQDDEVPGVDEETRHLLESENILIYRNELTLGEIIGVGHFGCVYRGELQRPGKDEKVEVAIKTLHNSSASVVQDIESFLQEGLMMKDFQHPNVLTLIGVCFEEGARKQPMVVIPYMKHGDLLAYIREENNHPTVRNLLTFGVQIAAGMAYLAEMKFVHRDLAARNCMLSADLEVKVADFGLSRDIYERDYYSSDNKKTKLPVKWMAPESLEKGTYSTKTDVWSYGVVLWELMTRGVSPYPDVDNWDIIQYLKSGRRMPQPSYCPDLLYKIMLTCWDESPKVRPTFSKLEEQVQNVIDTMQGNAPQHQVGLNVTYINYPVQQHSEAT